MKRIVSFCIQHSLFFNLLSAFIFICGLVSLLSLQREAFPLVTMDIMAITVTYPGSSPKEVEKLITLPVEKAVKEVDGIDKIYSVSLEGSSLTIITIAEDLSKADKEQVKTDIQRAIDRIQDLPDDAERPVTREMKTHEMPAVEVNLSGLAETELRAYANLLKTELEQIPDVSSIVKQGWRDREFWVEVDPFLLKGLHLSLPQIVAALKSKNVNLPGGRLRQPGQEYLVRTMGEMETVEEVQKVVIRSNDIGKANQIEDVATVIDTFSEETRLEKVRGKKAVSLIVLKRASGDAITIVSSVKKIIQRFREHAPTGLSIDLSNDMSYYVKRRLSVLNSNGLFGMVLVILVLLFFLSKRIALITSLGIPFAFFTTFIIMKLTGITLNLIAMFGLIIVSGMLIDDSIIFAENIFNQMQRGKSPKEAALEGSAEVFLPVLGSVLTTIVAFLPLMFMSGVMGKFSWQIAAVVIIALLASLFEAVFILPVHCAKWTKPEKERLITPPWLERLSEHYHRGLERAVASKYKVLGGTLIACVAAVVVGIKVIPFSLFPARGIEIFFIRANTPMGSPLQETSERLSAIEKIVSELPKEELDTFTTQVGISRQDVHDPFTKYGSHVGQVVIYLTAPSKRKRDADQIIRDLEKKTAGIHGFEFIRFAKVKPGPPIGKEISIEIQGDDFSVLGHIAELYKSELKTIKGIKDIEDSLEEGKKEYQVVVNEMKASQAGLSVGEVAQSLRNAFEGTVATTIKKSDEEIAVRVKVAEKQRHDPNIFNTLLIPNHRENLIPLKEIAQIQTSIGLSHINHYNHKRRVAVSATIDPKITTSYAVNRALQKKFKDIESQFLGTTVEYGGEQEDSNKSLKSLGKAFLIALSAIFMILCLTFGSLIQPIIVLFTLPLAAIGVVLAFLTHMQPFSFMALLGMVGLAGVVVNNAIVLIDLFNQYRAKDLPLEESVLAACKQRLRPILLTSITTIFGLGPIAYGIGGSDEIVKPAALALSWGLFFSTFFTLFVIPCLYLVLYEALEFARQSVWPALRPKSYSEESEYP